MEEFMKCLEIAVIVIIIFLTILIIMTSKYLKNKYQKAQIKWAYNNDEKHYRVEPLSEEVVPYWKNEKDIDDMEKAKFIDLSQISKTKELVATFKESYCKLYIIDEDEMQLLYVKSDKLNPKAIKLV